MWLISRGFKSHSVIGYSSKNLMEIQGVEKKNTGKFQGVVKVLMEFQGVQFLKIDILNGGVRTISRKLEKPILFIDIRCLWGSMRVPN